MVKFIQNAELRRLQGATLNDQLNGALIVYDNKTDVFTMTGQGQGKQAGAGGRVRVMLTPKNAASAPAGADPKPSLKPSSSLAGDKK